MSNASVCLSITAGCATNNAAYQLVSNRFPVPPSHLIPLPIRQATIKPFVCLEAAAPPTYFLFLSCAVGCLEGCKLTTHPSESGTKQAFSRTTYGLPFVLRRRIFVCILLSIMFRNGNLNRNHICFTFWKSFVPVSVFILCILQFSFSYLEKWWN